MGIEKHLPLMEDIKFASGFEDVTVAVEDAPARRLFATILSILIWLLL